MAKETVKFTGHLYDDAGDAINGATVNLYIKGGTSTSLANTTTNSDGKWTMTHTPADGTAGEFDVQITSGSSKRRLKFEDDVQLQTIDAETLIVRGNESAAAAYYMFADEGGDDSDKWKFSAADSGGVLTFENKASGSYVAQVTITPNSTAASSTVAIAGHGTVGGDLTVTGATTLNGNVTLGNAASDVVTVNGTLAGASALQFEGATADGYETTVAFVDPTADRTIYFPNLGGYLPVLAVASTTAISATPEELNIMDGVTSTAAEINLIDGGTARGTTAIADGDGVLINDGGTMRMTTVETLATYLEGEMNAFSLATTFSNTITVGVDNTGYDVKFFGATSGSYWLWDEDADGVVQIGTLTIGVNDAGHDVKFFGNTASAYMLWDTSADDLILSGAAGLDVAGTATLATVDINAGAIDGTAIGAASAAAGTFAAVVGTTGTFSGVMDITDTTDSSDATGDTGALRTEGGASIAKKLYVGTDLDVDGTAELDNITIAGAQGSDGQVLTSTGSGVGWEAVSSTASVATTVTITDNESTDEDNAIIFTSGGDVDGGNIGLESDGTLTYNPSTGKVTATGFVGTLTGNVTGDASGTAATVTGGTQASITTVANVVEVGALDAGSITSGFGAIDNGTSNIRTATFTAETAVVPDAASGATLGTAALEWGHLYIGDDQKIYLGDGQDVSLEYDEDGTDQLRIAGNTIFENQVQLDKDLLLDPTPADTVWSGVTAKFTAGEDLEDGECVYLKAADTKMWKATANAGGTGLVSADIMCVAMCVADVSADAVGTFLLQGFLRADTNFPTYAVGETLYLPEAETSGKNVPEGTVPGDDGDFVQVLGWAADANTVYFSPNFTLIEVA